VPTSSRKSVVLIVDDHEDTRELYVQFFEVMGYAAREATTCTDALAQIRSGGIDAIILDRRLPDGDGADVCRALKHDPHTRGVPVIVLSGRVEEAPLGADAYLMKPVTPDDVLKRLEPLLEKRRG
jgi:DNA-binding response OmpR family regulator